MSFFTKDETMFDVDTGKTKVFRSINIRRVALFGCLALFLLITLLNCFTVIPSGFTGVRTTFGQINQEVVPNGFVLKVPYVQHIQKVNNKQQEIVFKDRVWGESSERTVVYMENVVVTYKINPEYSAWIYANVANYDQNALPQSLVASAMKASMVSLPSAEVTNRSKIEALAVKNLQDAIDTKYGGERIITIINVNVDNMDFEESYNKAIADKQVAQLQYEQQQIENQKIIEQANKDAEVVRIQTEYQTNAKVKQAEADAEVRRIAAQAEADDIRTVSEAQAAANKALSAGLTRELIDYEKIKTWNGELPQVSGTGTIIGVDMK